LGQAVHALADFKEDSAVDNEVCEGVHFDDEVREKSYWDPHVLFVLHGRVEVEVLDIGAQEACFGGGDGAVGEEFDSSHVGTWSRGDPRIVDEVATDCPSHVVGVRFLRSVADYRSDIPIGGGVSWGELAGVDAFSGAGASDFCGPPTRPSVNLPISLMLALIYISASGPLRRWRYSREVPVVGSRTALTK
jgi:hypothetical protein